MIHLCFRGELYYADLGHGIGSEQEGCRPVVILQNDVGNAYSPTTIIAPISRRSHTKADLPTHYPLEPVAGLAQPSVVLLEQIRVIDKGRLDRRIGILSEKSMRGIDNAIRISVGLTAISQRIPLCLCNACAGKLIGTGVFYLPQTNSVMPMHRPPLPSMPTKLPLQKQKPLMSEPVYLLAEAQSPRKRGHDASKSKNPFILQASILTRKVEGKSSKKFGFWCLQKSGFGREPQSEPQDNLRSQKGQRKVRKTPDFLSKSGVFMAKNHNNDTADFGCTPLCGWGAFYLSAMHPRA